jgi:cytochrome c-type biogenesis protein CcmF
MGQILIYIGFAGALLSSIFFFSAQFGNVKNIRLGRLFFHIAAVSVISSAAFLLYLILSHQFQYTYVWDYSSRDLPLNLLISTFYAGQEGSFHLWAFLISALGIFLLPYLGKRDLESKDKYEPAVMGVFTLLMSFLVFILIIKSPYLLVWESFPKDVAIGFVPPDGRGLNPLLQNFWMSIHPPILFTGFTSLSIPFCFAVAALIKNKYDRWLKLALPWTLFGGMVLGLGIMLGGFWAYGVLGWGGYWGWDPVENSSFVPWLVIVAAIHTMITEERTGKFKKMSLLLCIMAYTLVLYSTFLTRSGVLGDASVHSFVDPGQEVYLFLIVFLSLFGGGGITLLIIRLKNLKTEKQNTVSSLLSRESALFTGAITICACALIVGIGTSWPVFAKGTVDPSFYNKMNLPLAIIIALVNGFSLLLKWKHSDQNTFLKSLVIPLGLSVVVTLFLVVFGVRDLLIAMLAAGAFFSFFINLELAYSLFVKNKTKTGAYIAHMGIMLLFLGIIGSSKYSQETNVSLPLDKPVEALGYKMTYKGSTPIPNDKEKFHFNVVCEKDGSGFLLQPIMYYSEYSKGVMKNPDIANLITKDLYLSPMSLEVPDEFTTNDIINLAKGEEQTSKGINIKFVDFDRSQFSKDNMGTDKVNIMGATLDVTINGKKQTVTAEQKISDQGSENIPIQIDGNDRYTFYLTSISVQGESKVGIAVVDNTMPKPDQTETLVLTASIKPFINLVWGGTIVMVLGFFTSLLNRYRLMKRESMRKNALNTNGNGHNKNITKKELAEMEQD